MSFLYVTCPCCKNADLAQMRREAHGKVYVNGADALASVLQETKTDWNEATRGAYRAKRRENEV